MIRIFIIVLLFTTVTATAQQPELIVHGTASNNYLIHKVVAKENWFSIGRLYNIHPKELATYNKSNVEKGLLINQVINVPIVAQNKVDFFGGVEEGEQKIPLYHIVKKDDALYRISVNNGTTMQAVREWNELTNDTVQVGQKLKVGFLKVKFAESALVNNSLSAIPTYAETPTVKTTDEKQPVVVTPNVTNSSNASTTSKTDTDPASPTVVQVKPGTDITSIEPRKGQEIQKVTIDTAAYVTATPASNSPALTDIGKETGVTTTAPLINIVTEGYFKNEEIAKLSTTEEKRQILQSGVFKCNAGWDDDKYFVLLNNTKPGTVIKVINPKSNKAVYAMVLDNNNQLGKTSNTDCALSKATAYALGIKEDVFEIALVK